MAGVLGSHVLCLLFLSLVLGVASNTDPCSVASTLHNADRRTKSSDPSNGVCDLRLNSTWVRVNTGSGSDLVTSCPALHAECGTSFPVWMSGAIPHTSEGEVTRLACVTSTRSCCEQALTVGVKNCGDFRVWRLPPTLSCPQAYCFEDPVWMPTTGFHSTGSTTPKTLTSSYSHFTRSPPNDGVQDQPSSDNHPDNPDHNDDNQPHDIDDRHDDNKNDDDGDVSDKGSPEQGEHRKRTRVLEIALGVVSSLLGLSLVLNAVLVYVWRARSRDVSSKSQKYKLPPDTAAPGTKPPSVSAPDTPPPSYKVTMATDQPAVSSWVDKECPQSF